jgi:hypothetical protein
MSNSYLKKIPKNWIMEQNKTQGMLFEIEKSFLQNRWINGFDVLE